ncbi:MAG TPA: pyridoxamine 5'-phosphate oxidase [Verrucomicrobia bacterium]|nr:MAG: pyridoxamine 5'-phosphate oxidase [Lentisphaerae bacterium GWF2_57_35]HBA82458.1 pyridoxamine 5'-phosphate oxidase [Verrucomicrobiota bacterium]
MSIITKVLSLPGLIRGLNETTIDPDPIVQFKKWYRFAQRAGCYWPNSMAVATVTPEGRPAVRLMLLKTVDARGFVFYTHYNGRKGLELEKTPYAALSFHWNELIRQVRVEGRVEKVSWEESNAYFQSRLRGSRIGAWASKQSKVLSSRQEFEQALRDYEQKFQGQEAPLPPHWGGYLVIPDRIEFWQGRPYRLHDRLCYLRKETGWMLVRLAP